MKGYLRRASILVSIIATAMLASPCFADDMLKSQAADWVAQTKTNDQQTITDTKNYFNNEISNANKEFYDGWHEIDQVTPVIEPLIDFQQKQAGLEQVQDQLVADQVREEQNRVQGIQQTAQNLQALAQEPASAPGPRLDEQSSNLYVRNYR